MKHITITSALAFGVVIFLCGCLSGEPARLELGHDFDGYTKRVIDTASSFKINDQFAMQLFNGAKFEVDSVKVSLFKGTAEAKIVLVFSQKIPVNPNGTDLVVRGPSSNPLSVRGFLRTSTPGSYYLEFSSADRIIAGKTIQLHNSKE